MGGRKKERAVFIRGGEQPNYAALLLFVAGCLLGMAAVYNSVRRAGYALPLALGLLCALAGVAFVAAKKDEQG